MKLSMNVVRIMLSFRIHVKINIILASTLTFFILQCNHAVLSFNFDRIENSVKKLQYSKTYNNVEKTLQATKRVLKLDEKTGQLSGLMHRPATQYALQLFNKLLDGRNLMEAAGKSWDQNQVFKSDTVRSYSPKDEKRRQTKRTSYKFHIPPLPNHEHLRQAELRVKLLDSVFKNRSEIKMLLTVKKQKSVIRKIRIRRKPVVDGEHLVYDITSMIRSWINGYHGDLTLKISLRENKSFNRISNSNYQREKDEAVLVFFSDDSGVTTSVLKNKTKPELSFSQNPTAILSRHKRSSHKKARRHKQRISNKTGKRRKCQNYDYEVDFDLIGWGKWIIHPKRFNAKACSGKCPTPISQKYKPTNHVVLLSLMRHRDNRAPRACCVPVKLRPLSMLYYEYDEIVVRHHQDMVAEECGCR